MDAELIRVELGISLEGAVEKVNHLSRLKRLAMFTHPVTHKVYYKEVAVEEAAK